MFFGWFQKKNEYFYKKILEKSNGLTRRKQAGANEIFAPTTEYCHSIFMKVLSLEKPTKFSIKNMRKKAT